MTNREKQLAGLAKLTPHELKNLNDFLDNNVGLGQGQ